MFVGKLSLVNYMAYEYNCWFHCCRWGKTHALLIEGGLTYDAIKQSVANASIAFREGVAELFEFLEVSLISTKVFSFSLDSNLGLVWLWHKVFQAIQWKIWSFDFGSVLYSTS